MRYFGKSVVFRILYPYIEFAVFELHDRSDGRSLRVVSKPDRHTAFTLDEPVGAENFGVNAIAPDLAEFGLLPFAL